MDHTGNGGIDRNPRNRVRNHIAWTRTQRLRQNVVRAEFQRIQAIGIQYRLGQRLVGQIFQRMWRGGLHVPVGPAGAHIRRPPRKTNRNPGKSLTRFS